jgi:hypothetical protein
MLTAAAAETFAGAAVFAGLLLWGVILLNARGALSHTPKDARYVREAIRTADRRADDRQEEEWQRETQRRQQEEARRQNAKRQQEQRERQRRSKQEDEANTRRDQGSQPRNGTTSKEWWEVLGVSARATVEEAKQAYRLKMKQYHPDKVAGLADEFVQLAEQRSREFNEALAQAKRNARSF